MTARKFSRLGFACGLFWLCATAMGAASDDAAGRFFQTRQAQPAPVLSAALLASALDSPAQYLGQVFEAPVTVSGLIRVADRCTALLMLGEQSLAVDVPSSLQEAWLASGSHICVLVQLQAAGDPPVFRLLTAAPQSEVAPIERAQEADRLAREAAIARATEAARLARPIGSQPSPANVQPDAPLSARAQPLYAPYRAAIRRLNRKLSERDVDKITTSVLRFSDSNDIDPRLVVAMIIAESDFDIYSTSRTGAMGLGQLMPENARELGLSNPYDPVQNIAGAARMLRNHLDKYGGAPAAGGIIPDAQIALTMAAYNAGPGAVRKYHGVPPYRETKRYVARVTALYKQMCGLTRQAKAR